MINNTYMYVQEGPFTLLHIGRSISNCHSRGIQCNVYHITFGDDDREHISNIKKYICTFWNPMKLSFVSASVYQFLYQISISSDH